MSLEHLLDLCLSQLNTGDADLESVLARYPAQRAELEPMLRAALALRQAPLPQPRPEARAQGRQRLLTAFLDRLDAESLDAALVALKSGQAPEEALAGHPHADKIVPLLRLAQAIEETPEPTPRWEAQAVGYARLIAAVEARRRFLDALDNALAQVTAGRPVDAVVAEMGTDAESLAPALRAALAVRQTPLVEPRAEAKAAGLARLRATLENHRALDTLLDRALNEIRAGASLPTVLARHAQHAAALEPLLRAALAVEATPLPAPRAEAKAAGLARLQAAVAARAQADAVVDDAVAELAAGRADVPMLLARHPQQADQLAPMLLAAAAAMSAPLPTPRARAQAEGRTRLMAAVSERRAALVAEKLDVAITRLRAGAALDVILAAEPAFAAELEPLLRAALAVEQTPLPVVNADARRQGERRVVQAAQARRRGLQPVRNPLAALLAAFHGPRGAVRHALMAAVISLFVLSSALIGVTRVAANSLPDETLYPVKLVTEQVQLALAASNTQRAQLHLAFAQERLREMQQAAAAGRDAQRALAQLPRHTESARQIVEGLDPEQMPRYEAQLSTVEKQAQVVIDALRPQLSPDSRRIAEQIVGTPTAAAVALPAPSATNTPEPRRPIAQSEAETAGVDAVVLPPTKTPVPPTATSTPLPPVVQPTAPPVVIVNPTSAPAPTQPADVPTEVPPPTIAPTRQVIPPGSGRSATSTPAPASGDKDPVQTSVPQPTDVVGPVQPTSTPLPPTATRTPAPQPTVIAPPTRMPRPTATPQPAPTSVPPTSVPPTSVPPTSVPPTSVPPTSVPPTSVPPTSVPPTSVPPTQAPAATPKP